LWEGGQAIEGGDEDLEIVFHLPLGQSREALDAWGGVVEEAGDILRVRAELTAGLGS
jgi:hypothetical protein